MLTGGTAREALIGGVDGAASSPTSEEGRGTPKFWRRFELVLWATPVVVVVIMATAERWTFDDGFIYFRTVDQLMAGNGPVFNAGERVESFTSPTWLALLTIGDLLSPLRLEFTAAVLSISCTAIGMWSATLGSARLARSEMPTQTSVLVPLGSIVFAALWPVWVWATSGLEVGLTFAWLGVCLLVLARWANDSDRQLVAAPGLILLGMGWLVRPELALSSVVFVTIVVALSGAGRRRCFRALAVAFALPVAYQIWRMGYYGLLVSSPAIAKEGTNPNLGAGWLYLQDFVLPYLLALPLAAVLFGVAFPLARRLFNAHNRRAASVVVVVAAAGLLHGFTVVLIGGDYVHARLLLPGLFAFLAPFFVVALTTRHVEVLGAVGAWALLAVFVFRPPADGRGSVLGTGYRGTLITHEDHGFARRGSNQPWIDGPGLYLAHWAGGGGDRTSIAPVGPDEVVVATYPLGAVGYSLGTEVRVIDLLGLADPLTGHRRLEWRGIPGHEKSASGPWLVARLARDPLTVGPNELDVGGPFDPRSVGLEFPEQVAWAEAALSCPSVERLVASYTEPMNVDRFIDNLWGSAANTRLRIPYLPEDAFRENCSETETPQSVVDFYQRPVFVGELSEHSDTGDIVVIDDCTAVYMGTGELRDPWAPADAVTFSADVTFDPIDTTARLAAVWILRPYGDASAIVWAETDGLGHYRLRQDIDWLPPTLQRWTQIPADGRVDVRMTPDLANRVWALSADATEVATVPMVSDAQALAAIAPEAAGPSATAGTIDIDRAPPEPSEACSEFLAAE